MANLHSLLILATSSPYGGPDARAALDVALTAAAFELDVTVVFLDDGVWQLQRNQDTGDDGWKNVGRMIPALAHYDVDKVYIHEPSAASRGLSLDCLVDDLQPVDDRTLCKMTAQCDQVLVF